MKKYSITPFSILFIFYLSVLLTSCLENNSVTEPVKTTSDFLYLATFLETQRNALSGPFPATVSADEVSGNLDNYLLIDIRERSDFISGHIPNSVNVKSEELIKYLNNIDVFSYPRIVIVSLTGQKASYCATLLRISGYYNVFSLNYGLGYWNSQFANEWVDSRMNSPYYKFYRNNYTPNRVNSLSDFPNKIFDDEGMTSEEKIDYRIDKLLKENISDFQITVDEFEENYDPIDREYKNCNIIYFGDLEIFNVVYRYSVVITDLKFYTGSFVLNQTYTLRPNGTIPFDTERIKIEENLLSIPVDKKIFVYGINGQESAAATAYLNVLGYPAKSIKYGAHSMYGGNFYNTYISGTRVWANKDEKKASIDTFFIPTPILQFSFDETFIQDYPIETGDNNKFLLGD